MPFTDTVKMADVIIADKDVLNATPADVLQGKKFIGSTPVLNSGAMPFIPERSDIEIGSGQSCNVPRGYNPTSYNVFATDLETETPGTASSSDIKAPLTAWVNGEQLTGRMIDRGGETALLACGDIYPIPEGYHDGTGQVEAKSLAEQTYGTALPEEIAEGSTCWVDGEEIIGTMAKHEGEFITLSAGDSYTIPQGYHDGGSVVNVRTLEEQTQGSAVASQIINEETAWVNGNEVVGTMPINSSDSIFLPLNGSYTIPQGYHTGEGIVTQNIPTKQGETVTPTDEAQIIEVAGHYMEGNITVTGVNAYNNRFPDTYMLDNNGNTLHNFQFITAGQPPQIRIYFQADNWHDNVSTNIYKIEFSPDNNYYRNQIDPDTGLPIDPPEDDNYSFEFYCYIHESQLTYFTFNGMWKLKLGFDETAECQYIDILTNNSNFVGIVTVTDVFCSRPYGI